MEGLDDTKFGDNEGDHTSENPTLWIGNIPKHAKVNQIMGAFKSQGFTVCNMPLKINKGDKNTQWTVLEVQDLDTQTRALKYGIKFGNTNLNVKKYQANIKGGKTWGNPQRGRGRGRGRGNAQRGRGRGRGRGAQNTNNNNGNAEDRTWKGLLSHKTCAIGRPISIGSSIWYSTYHNKGENGMIQYDITKDSVTDTVPYAQDRPHDHDCCQYKNVIFMVEGTKAHLMSFNSAQKQFEKTVKIPRLGHGTGCIAIRDDIHIFNGSRNNGKHLIYSTITHKLKRCADYNHTSKVRNQCILQYKNQIIRFSGWDANKKEILSSFWMSSPIKPNQKRNIEWSRKDAFALNDTRYRCGYTLYKHFIITFGGEVKQSEYTDAVFVLDLEKQTGWVKVNRIKCPIKSQYFATVTPNKMVHLFTGINQWPQWDKSVLTHYSIPIAAILGSEDAFVQGKGEASKQMEEKKDESLEDEEEKEEKKEELEPRKCVEKRFYKFLEDMGMDRYFDKFKENECCDMDSIQYFDDDTLKNEIGIGSTVARKKFLGKCEEIKVEMQDFKNNCGLSSLLYKQVAKYGIVTLDILCVEVKDKLSLANVYKIENTNAVDQLWDLIQNNKQDNQNEGVVPQVDELGEGTAQI
eukprot:1168246_1